MKNYEFVISLVLTLIIVTSCSKDMKCSGTVYSRNHIPMPDIKVYLIFGRAGHSDDYVQSTVSDSKGNFSVQNRIGYRVPLDYLSVSHKDSGYVRQSVSSNVVTDIDLILN